MSVKRQVLFRTFVKESRDMYRHVSSFALLFCSWIALLPIPTLAGVDPPTERPNIIYILTDDLGYGDLGCYGQRIIRTPNIDRLAAEGLRFTQHYSGNTVCAPSRCSLLTGKHPGHAWIRDNREIEGVQYPVWRFDIRERKAEGQFPLPAGEVTIAEQLKAEGYATGAVGKWGLGYPGSEGEPRRQGFDFFYGFNCHRHSHTYYPTYLWRNDRPEPLEGNSGEFTGRQYAHDLFMREAGGFIRENRKRPFFLYLALTIPHLSIQVPEASLAEYQGKIPEEPFKLRPNDSRYFLLHPTPRAGYAAMVSHMDRDIGRLVDLLKNLGLDKRTLIVFTSDNGPENGRVGGVDSKFFKSAGSLRGLKGSLYEGGIRVPMIARWPGRITPGTVTGHVSAAWDVMPTLLDLCGAAKKIRPNADGISFAPTLLGQGEQQKHDYLYWEFSRGAGLQAVRLGDWKGVRHLVRSGEAKMELYNLAEDVGEQHDVSEQQPDTVRRIEGIMEAAHVPSEHFKLGLLDGK